MGQDAVVHGIREWHYAKRATHIKCPLSGSNGGLICSGLRKASAPDEEAEHLALGSSKLTGCFSC